MREHPLFPQLRATLTAAETAIGPWEGRVYRAVEVQWAHPRYLVSGQGTRKHGGRWMRPSVTAVVHGALTEAIALKESRRAFAYYGIRKPRNTPRVSVEIVLRLHRVLDLCPVESVFPFLAREELISEDWEKANAAGWETLAQAVGRAVWESRIEGMLVPSVRDRRSRNVVWFPDNIARTSTCEIVGQNDLGRWIAD